MNDVMTNSRKKLFITIAVIILFTSIMLADASGVVTSEEALGRMVDGIDKSKIYIKRGVYALFGISALWFGYMAYQKHTSNANDSREAITRYIVGFIVGLIIMGVVTSLFLS